MKKDDIYRSQFRLPYSLYEKLKESAEANNRSVNAELIDRLEYSFNTKKEAEKIDLNSLKAAHEDINKQIREIKEFIARVKIVDDKN